MPFNGQGVFSRLYNWTLDAAQNINILPDRMDNDANDIAAGLSNCVTRDGQAPMLAALPMGGFQINSLAAPTSAADAANKAYVDGAFVPLNGSNPMTAALNLGGFQINNVAAPVLATDAVTKGYVDTATAARSMGGFQINNLAAATVGTDAANKAYVDAQAYSVSFPAMAGFTGCELVNDGVNQVFWSQKAKRQRALSVLNFIGY